MKSMTLLCMGDSLTFGYEIEPSKRWTGLLEKALPINVLNYGINGDTTTGMLSRFLQAHEIVKPTHTLIFGGTNDLWFGLNDAYIISNIYAMCKQAIYLKSIPVVGIPTPSYNLHELNFAGDNYSECIRRFQQILINHCLDKDLNFIDFSEVMGQDCFMEDGIHYNETGHKVMMNHVEQKLMGFL